MKTLTTVVLSLIAAGLLAGAVLVAANIAIALVIGEGLHVLAQMAGLLLAAIIGLGATALPIREVAGPPPRT